MEPRASNVRGKRKRNKVPQAMLPAEATKLILHTRVALAVIAIWAVLLAFIIVGVVKGLP